MGPVTGHVEEETKPLTIRDQWVGILARMYLEGSGASILKHLPGWRVDATTFIKTPQLMPEVIPLRPTEDIFWGGDGAKAKKHLEEWRLQLGGDVLYLIVRDPEFPDNPWLAQPVKKEWLSLSVSTLLDRVAAFRATPEGLMYRAALIATTGKSPEELRESITVSTLDY